MSHIGDRVYLHAKVFVQGQAIHLVWALLFFKGAA